MQIAHRDLVKGLLSDALLNILCTLAIIVLVLHVLEEWVLPGGLHYSYNIAHGSSLPSRYPMNRLTDMITNFGGVVLGCVALKVRGFCNPAGIAVMLFSAFEVVIHVTIGIQDMALFGFCFLLINLPEMTLGRKDTPYEFTNRGYYERFAPEFEEAYGYQYFESETAMAGQ